MINLMERYENVVARYQDAAVTDTVIIEKLENGKVYSVTYNYMTSPCSGGIFEKLEEAEESPAHTWIQTLVTRTVRGRFLLF